MKRQVVKDKTLGMYRNERITSGGLSVGEMLSVLVAERKEKEEGCSEVE